MQPPIYSVSQEDGAPHECFFVMVCLVGGHHRETGLGKSKKLAKRQVLGFFYFYGCVDAGPEFWSG
jgi:dsRNA-specific ribonuclease